MSDPSAQDIVAGHLSAVWNADWAALDRSLSGDAELLLGDLDQSELKAGILYRHITQAWDFFPGTVELCDCGDGKVTTQMELTNGADWFKSVQGEYLVENGLISRVRLVDGMASRRDPAR